MFETTRQAPRTTNALTRALIVLSLGLNIFLVGWVLTQSLGLGGPSYAKPDPAPEVVADTIAGLLPKADGDLVRRAVEARRQPLAEARAKYLTAIQRLRQVISSEPLDTAALHEAVGEVRRTRQAERELFGDTIVSTIPEMSPEGRRAFVATHLGGRP